MCGIHSNWASILHTTVGGWAAAGSVRILSSSCCGSASSTLVSQSFLLLLSFLPSFLPSLMQTHIRTVRLTVPSVLLASVWAIKDFPYMREWPTTLVDAVLKASFAYVHVHFCDSYDLNISSCCHWKKRRRRRRKCSPRGKEEKKKLLFPVASKEEREARCNRREKRREFWTCDERERGGRRQGCHDAGENCPEIFTTSPEITEVPAKGVSKNAKKRAQKCF